MIKLVKLKTKDKPTLKNLLQLYLHDITASLPMDVNEHGLFKYDNLDLYFTDKDGFGYLIYIEDKIIGFVLIDYDFMVLDKSKDIPSYNLSELFILNAYKKIGYGETVVKQIFDMYKGNWEVRPVPRSEGAKKFWLRVIKKYTNNQFTENYPKQNRLAITFKNI